MHVKGSKYHTLIWGFRKSLPTTMQSGLSVLCLTNWGGVGAASQESLGRRPSPFSGHQRSGEWKPQLSMAKYIHMTFMWAWNTEYRSHLLRILSFRFDKNRNILERKSDLCVNEEYSWKETLVMKLKSGDRGGAKLSHQFPLHLIIEALWSQWLLVDAFVLLLSTSLCKQVVLRSST